MARERSDSVGAGCGKQVTAQRARCRMMRQSVLVIGASGQVGRELVLSAPSNYELVAPASREFDIRDVQSVARVIDRIRPDLVINAAAYTAVDKAESERESAFATNADGAGNVARAC